MRVEFLIIVSQDDEFCTDKDTFLNLLRTSSSLLISTTTIQYKDGSDSLKANYQLYTDKIPAKAQRYFHLVLNYPVTPLIDSSVEHFNGLVRSIKKILKRVSSENLSIDIIWDDISYYYSLQAYPIINEIENLMRKLIIKFMVVNIGAGWSSQATPDEFKEKIDKKKNSNAFQNILYDADFIQLAHFLFKKYRTVKQHQLDDHIFRLKENEPASYELLRNYVPKSNWERYFEGKLNYMAESLENDWKDLYELRNKIAHNRGIEKSDLEDIKAIANQIKGALEDAIVKLEQGTIEITEAQKTEIINVAETANFTEDENIVLAALGDSEKWLARKLNMNPDAFIGYSHFINSQVMTKGLEFENAKKAVRKIADKGFIEIYQKESSSDDFRPLLAIKILRKIPTTI